MNSKLLLLILISLFVTRTNAQSQEGAIEKDQENKLLFRSEKLDLSTFYFELSPVSLSNMNGQSENTSYISGGFILNKKFSFGVFSESSPKLSKIGVPKEGTMKYQEWLEAGVEMDRLDPDVDSVFITFMQSGLHFGYLHNTNKVVFWRAGMKLGLLGGIRLAENQTFLGLFDNPVYKTNLLTITPEIGVGVNLLKWWRVHIDVGYRLLITSGINNNLDIGENFNSMAFRFGFSFGAFGK